MPNIFELIGGFGVSLLIVCVLMPVIIPYLRKLKFGQQIIEEYGPTWHKNKQGVPTMGGLVFIFAVIVSFVVFGVNYYTEASFLSSKGFACLTASCLFGLIGFIDDFIKIRKKQNLGLTEIQKLILQFLVAGAFVVFTAINRNCGTSVILPFGGGTRVDLGFIAYIIWFCAIIGFTNAVNFTDGIDGLAAGVTIPVGIFLVFVSNITLNSELSLLSVVLVGALVGFLIFNWHPARIFMGDTGSMFLGGMVTTIAISLDMTVVMIIAGAVYLAEALSVIIQRIYFKITHGKRLFKMTPIHHSFELSGWKEEKIVLAFTAVSIVACAIASAVVCVICGNNILLI